MFAVNINIESLAQSLTSKLEGLDYGRLTREIAYGVKDKMQKRIHVEGKNSQGQEIGKYSLPYLHQRAKHRRGGGQKVILSLTREMENDCQVVPLTEKSYGIGFGNRHNFDKMKWNNKRYGIPIFAMSEEEKKVMRDIIQRYVKELQSS